MHINLSRFNHAFFVCFCFNLVNFVTILPYWILKSCSAGSKTASETVDSHLESCVLLLIVEKPQILLQKINNMPVIDFLICSSL